MLGKQQAAFGGVNPAVGSNIMYFPGGRSLYKGVHLAYHGVSGDNPTRRVRRLEMDISYTLSQYKSNIGEPNGSGGDYSLMNVAEDYNRPHLGHWGASGTGPDAPVHVHSDGGIAARAEGFDDRACGVAASAERLYSAAGGGGVAGEIFRSDLTGDGTVGRSFAETFIGSTGKYSNSDLTKVIQLYDSSIAGQLTPAGNALLM